MSHEPPKCKMHKIERIVKVNDCIWIRVGGGVFQSNSEVDTSSFG